jgi:nucleoside-diphosphate-sugar epimerase
MKILMTGATGFIGSHIAENLVKEGHQIYAICRNKSNFDKCEQFKNKVTWINQDYPDWRKEMVSIELDQFIHTAWAGVTATERNDWTLQLSNFEFSKSMIDLAIRLNAQKIICLGSQAEYGMYNYKVTEEHVPEPADAYGAIKLLTLYYLQNSSAQSNISWYWLRIFSVIGENENKSWLLSQVMDKLLSGEEIELTPGEQFYDYLYIADFIHALKQIITCDSDLSAVYNICSGRPVKIKQLLLLVAEKLNSNISALKFGAIPYRKNQNRYMVGSPERFEAMFGQQELYSLDKVITNITNSFKVSKK